MNKIFVTLDPILDVNPMSMAEWCASMPKSPENAPVDISTRWAHHVNDREIDPANLKKLGRYSQFEKKFPFYKMDVNGFILHINKAMVETCKE